MRPVNVAAPDIAVSHGDCGAVYLRSRVPLPEYPVHLTERLDHWAEQAGTRVFLAERDASGGWRTVTYAAALASVRRLAQALLERGLSAERPLLILSGNSIDHALLALAATYVGVWYAPIAPAYSLQARDFGALGQIFDRVNPALVFASDGSAYEPALDAVLPADVELVVSASTPERMRSTRLSELESTVATSAVDDAHASVGAETIAKLLFTSGSTGHPKGVVNTHRMLCANQAMIQSVLPFLAEEPPVLCDWLPWNHTAGGNHNFGIVLYNGGTFYIDDGRPAPGAFDRTVRNLRDVSATAHFTVPRTYDMLLPHLRADADLRERFFARLRLFFYAAAGLTERVFDELQQLAVETLGDRLLWITGFGATETAPLALSTGSAGAWSGFVGFPVPGVDFKLARVGEKLEGRVRGPTITPGYWRDASLTREAFDEEGYYRLGDAFRLVDSRDPSRGLIFDGRLAEDFKLSTGTWVSVGPLRARFLARAAGLAQDVVIAGHDREFVAALIFPNVGACRELCPDRLSDNAAASVVADSRVRDAFRAFIAELAAANTGSSTFVARAILLDQPPSIDAREITDKGSLNQKAVLQNRARLVDELYAADPSSRVIVV